MDWMKIFSAIILGGMVIYLWPRAKHMLKHSPKASGDDWKSFLLPMAGVVLFVVFLVVMTRR